MADEIAKAMADRHMIASPCIAQFNCVCGKSLQEGPSQHNPRIRQNTIAQTDGMLA